MFFLMRMFIRSIPSPTREPLVSEKYEVKFEVYGTCLVMKKYYIIIIIISLFNIDVL